MRLLSTSDPAGGSLHLSEFLDDRVPKYAILSHTWGDDEVTFQDVIGNTTPVKTTEGYKKLEQSCAKAKEDGFDYIWVDTCCIDKTSSAELSEAINSMFRWYQEAEVCYAHLADFPSKKASKGSKWFTRGWTLQELIAPKKLVFLNDERNEIGTRTALRQPVSECTQIPTSIFLGSDRLESFSIAQRMSWAAERQTSRVEDRAYSLLGLFGVNMPLIYGERENAFLRLQEEIMRISDDHTLFAWRSPDERGGLLATSPAAFKDSHDIVQCNPFDPFNSPFTVTSTGIHLDLRFMGIGPQGLGLAILHCQHDQGGESLIALYVRDLYLTMHRFQRVQGNEFAKFNLQKFQPSRYPSRKMCLYAGRTKVWRGFATERGIESHYDCNDAIAHFLSSNSSITLLEAAERGLEDIVWLKLTLSDTHADLTDPSGQTALMRAARSGHEGVVKILTAHPDVKANRKDAEGRTPLWWAAEAGYANIVNLLIEKCVTTDMKNSEGLTPLFVACQNEREAATEVLLNKGASTAVQDLQSRTPLLYAISQGYEGIVRILLKHGADIKANGSKDALPLLHATSYGNEAVMRALLLHGADTERRDDECMTLLLRATSHGNEGAVSALLSHGADTEARDKSSLTPLLLAASRRRRSLVRLLLKGGADIEAQDYKGRTPLSLVVCSDLNEGVLSELLEQGANLNVRDGNSLTALLSAIQSGCPKIVKLLLKGGADIKATDLKGYTPLRLASVKAQDAVAARDRGGYTPLLITKAERYVEVVRVLQEHLKHSR